MVFTVNKFFCLSLPTAGKSIANFGLGLSLYKVFTTVSTLIRMNNAINEQRVIDNEELNDLVSKEQFENFVSRTHSYEYDFGRVYLQLTAHLLNVVACVLLFTGIHKNCHQMMLPWIIFKALGLIIIVPITMYLFVYSGFMSVPVTPDLVIIGVVLFLLLGISIWAWMAVYSLYVNIRTMKQEPPSYDKTQSIHPYLPQYVSFDKA